MSSATSVNEALTGYLAGRVTAEQLAGTVTAAYYRERGMGNGEWLKPVIEVIERAHPGVVELAGSAEKPGFAVWLAERRFPKRLEGDLRGAVEGIVAIHHSPVPESAGAPGVGVLARVYQAVRRFFSA
jgi:hypothetical protein